jgi:hypothetical protein
MPRRKTSTAKRREWDRATELLSLFVWTGVVKPKNSEVKPQSIVLVGPPGSGKTELLLRFRNVPGLTYRSDLTVRGLWRLLVLAKKGRVRHVVFPEFQKIFQRKLATAENTIGTLTEAMEEGVLEADVGPVTLKFDGARLGILGGMTGRTLARRRGLLYEIGFLDRCIILPWELPDSQKRELLHRVTVGDRSDLEPVNFRLPTEPVTVEIPPKVGKVLEDYVWQHWPDESLRMQTRFRLLTMASAAWSGRDVAKPEDVERGVEQFADYWDRVILTPGGD